LFADKWLQAPATTEHILEDVSERRDFETTRTRFAGNRLRDLIFLAMAGISEREKFALLW